MSSATGSAKTDSIGDAVDRLLLAEFDTLSSNEASRNATSPMVVVDDLTGALTEGLVSRVGVGAVRRCHDSLMVENTVTAELMRLGIELPGRPLDTVFSGASVVVARLPKSLDALAEIAGRVVEQANPGVWLLVGSRIKHLSRGANQRLAAHFVTVDASLGRQKCRVLRARGVRDHELDHPFDEPDTRWHDDLELTLCAFPGTFAGASIDRGSRALLGHFDRLPKTALDIVDLGCGSGVLAVAAARARPEARVLAVDDSWAAVRSSVATAEANRLTSRIVVEQADAATSLAEESVDVVVCNPPFHLGTTRDSSVAFTMIKQAARSLRPGGELWVVYNSHLPYLSALRRLGQTTIESQDREFTVARTRIRD